MPEIKIKLNEINEGINLIDFLSKNKIMSSKGEARRAIVNNGIKINNQLVSNEKLLIKETDFQNKILKISFGKKKHYIVKIT